MREGLAGTRTLWPISNDVSPDYIFPSHIWDGFISLLLSGVYYIIYIFVKKGKIITLFFPFITKNGTVHKCINWLLIASVLCGFISSILCFLNVYILF